ncbi:MAG: replication-associated recombination protein A [Burkholderiaceae bacterium]|nr:replication-associated recombination protein A [Pseudomonadota bacterium]MDP4740595.1 replication-associated recombination protein A [Burkholderiaceae bacterium]
MHPVQQTPMGLIQTTAPPLAERLRPQRLDQVVGQQHLLGPQGPLTRAAQLQRLPSMILWGPPGVGKTTLARLLAQAVNARMLSLSAVLSGVKEIREAVAQAELWQGQGERVVVFVDEVHRFNKSQQDAFLPHVESGLFVFVGATTENPGFEVNSALLSRAQVFRLESLSANDLSQILLRGLEALEHAAPLLSEDAQALLIATADGDGRKLLNLLEMLAQVQAKQGEDEDHEGHTAAAAPSTAGAREPQPLGIEALQAMLPALQRQFDKGGDAFYDQISALHKSVRGSDPDASLYWLARMLDGGADPRYIARRLIRMASEDIGLADPRALTLCLEAAQAYERLGSPEGELALAQATVFLAVAAKSNAVYTAWKSAQRYVQEQGSMPVPNHLRNAPTRLAKSMGHGADYRYSHDEPDAFSAGQRYFPDAVLKPPIFYSPVPRGLESKMAEKLAELRRRN